jgi:hypothetical protein
MRSGARTVASWRSGVDDTVICTYDLAKFSATAVMDILRTHPMVIVGEVMQENPFYTPPDQLLPELSARRQQRAS